MPWCCPETPSTVLPSVTPWQRHWGCPKSCKWHCFAQHHMPALYCPVSLTDITLWQKHCVYQCHAQHHVALCCLTWCQRPFIAWCHEAELCCRVMQWHCVAQCHALLTSVMHWYCVAQCYTMAAELLCPASHSGTALPSVTYWQRHWGCPMSCKRYCFAQHHMPALYCPVSLTDRGLVSCSGRDIVFANVMQRHCVAQHHMVALLPIFTWQHCVASHGASGTLVSSSRTVLLCHAVTLCFLVSRTGSGIVLPSMTW